MGFNIIIINKIFVYWDKRNSKIRESEIGVPLEFFSTLSPAYAHRYCQIPVSVLESDVPHILALIIMKCLSAITGRFFPHTNNILYSKISCMLISTICTTRRIFLLNNFLNNNKSKYYNELIAHKTLDAHKTH